MERIDIQRIALFLLLAAMCVAVVVLGSQLERNERFGNAFLALFGSVYVFTFLGKISMPFPGLTAEPGKKEHLFARVAGFICGMVLIAWGVSSVVAA